MPQDSKATNTGVESTAGPMTISSGSDALAKDAGIDTASPYGTRSRNRTGSSRPNYAEDKDIETDVYDYYHDKRDGDSKKSSRQASAAVNGDAPRVNATSRKAGAEDGRTAQLQNGTKEQQSGGSTTPSANAQAASVSQTSRKRKANTQPAGSTSQPAPTSSSVKKNGAVAVQQMGISWPDTNMLTFENCNARPDNRRMVADDGTVLEPNGDTPEIHTHVVVKFDC